MAKKIIIFLLFIKVLLFAQSALINSDSLGQRLREHVFLLASDALQGRATGSNGERLAADYVVRRLKESGIRPFGENQTWFQNIPMHGSRPLPATRMCLIQKQTQRMPLRLSKDFLLYRSGAQTFIATPTELVFAGYGISAPEFDYNDYQSVDVQGKIVVFLSGEPSSQDARYFAGAAPTVYSYAESKQRTAIAHGAIGSILLHIPGASGEQNWAHYQQAFSFEDVTLAYRVTGNLSVLLNATDSVAAFLFRDSGYSLADVLNLAAHNALHSFPLKTKLRFNGSFAERDFVTRNVVGVLPANSVFKKDEYVIVSAHYDHLGIGLPVQNDSIYNGAMDNAAGVAGVLELALLLNAPEVRRNRPLIFLFVTGEEKGLLGSAYYTEHPRVPLYKTMANLNVDGLAMFDRFFDVVGVGAEYSSLEDVLKEAAAQDSLQVAPVPPQFLQYESFSRSDQMSFAWAGIPSILIMDGLNYRHLTSGEGLQKMLNWNKHIYHSPFDDVHQPVNWKAAAQHVRFLAGFLIALLNTRQKIAWRDGVPFKNIRLQTIAEQR